MGLLFRHPEVADDYWTVELIDELKHVLKVRLPAGRHPIADDLNTALNDIIEKWNLATQHRYAVHPYDQKKGRR